MTEETKQQSIRYYLFALANFSAALGGGTILGKGVGVVDVSFLKTSSILALFVGTLLGLIYLQIVPKKWSAKLARWFSFFGAMISIFLLYVFQSNETNGKLVAAAGVIFFSLLSLRFGFWFYSRVLRASAAAGQQQQIAWVEMGYYVGMIFGLIIWTIFGINFDLVTALIIDAFLQCGAGLLDIIANRLQVNVKVESQANQISREAVASSTQEENIWIWRLIMAVVFFTIAIQTIIFYSAHQVSEWFTPYILALFYFGVSIAAYVYKKFNFQLEWSVGKNKKHGYAILYSNNKKYKQKISFLFSGILTAAFTAVALLGALVWHWGVLSPIGTNTFFNMIGKGEITLLMLVVISAFLYEILALAILDRIGVEEKSIKQQGMVMRAYGLMGVGGAVCLWVLGLSESSIAGSLFALSLCVVVTFSAIWKRKFI